MKKQPTNQRLKIETVVPGAHFTDSRQEKHFMDTLQAYFPRDFQMPVNHNIEQVVIGTVVGFSGAITLALPHITHKDFHNPLYSRVFKICMDMYGAGEGIDMLTVGEEYSKRHGRTVASMLVECTGRVASDAHLVEHCKALKDYSQKRAAIEIGLSAVRAGLDEQTTGTQSIAYVQRWIMDAAQTGIGNARVKSPDEIALALVKRLDLAVQRGEAITGYKTHIPSIDKLFGGLQPTDLIIIAARPSMGKTSMLMSLFYNSLVPIDERKPVLLFSLEMNAMSLYYKLVAFDTGISVSNIAKGQVTEDELRMINDKIYSVTNSKIYVVDASGLSIEQMTIISKLVKYQLDIAAIGMDYISLATTEDDYRRQSKVHEVGQITAGLKGIAKDLEIPVVALSQLSRAVETRGGSKMPQLSDLRESGNVEQDADIVAFLMRPEYYGMREWTIDNNEVPTKNLLLFNVAKYRNGPLDTLPLHFEYTTTQVTDTFDRVNGGQVQDNAVPFAPNNLALNDANRLPDGSRINDKDIPF